MENLEIVKYPWYYGKISRREAEENLIDRGENEGCFLVRESQSCPGQWTISVLDWTDRCCHVKHFLVSQSTGGLFYLETDVAFISIAELIQHYKDHPRNVAFYLKQPCPKVVRIPEKDSNDYDLYETTAELPAEEEFCRENLLYSGSFSNTWRGHLKSCKTLKVVAKIATDDNDSSYTLRHEANMLKYLNHESIVLLRGVVSEPVFHAVFHDCGDANLVEFLLNDGGFKLSFMDQLNIAKQVVSALEFCGRMKCVHRNVKAKSVIVNSKDLRCRLASFKHARTVGEHGYFHAVTNEDRLASLHSSRVRWMAIEAAQHGRFSQASDAWSFAVLLVEVFTRGELPYAGYLTCKVMAEVENGFRCPKPQACPQKIYNLMHQCWAQREESRPCFRAIKELLKKYTEDNKETLSKLSPPRPPDYNRYAMWKLGSVKQQRTCARELSSLPCPMPTLATPPPTISIAQYVNDPQKTEP